MSFTNTKIYGCSEADGGEGLRLLRMRIIDGHKLAKKDIFGASDPYVKVDLVDSQDNTVIDSFYTKTKKRTLNPTWDEEFLIRANPTKHHLNLEVYDENRLTRDDLLGSVEIPLANISTEQSHKTIEPKYYTLNPSTSRSKVKGQIQLYHAFVCQPDRDPMSVTELDPSLKLLEYNEIFLDYTQLDLMKRVVNIYKEWICNGSGPTPKLGELLQIFILNSSNAFVARLPDPNLLDEQVEMCKRIMNVYRFMVMKIYMDTRTWEQLLNVMLSITEHLFPEDPPDKKESTIGGRIAPAFFQTFIVSWIRANLYVHISDRMWSEFHRVMRTLVKWRELIEEWSTTMESLTRVLVKHVYNLNLLDLPLDKPVDRFRRTRAMNSTAEAISDQPSSSKPARQQGKNDKCVLLGGSQRGWTPENSVIMWRRMLGLFGNINSFEDPENHLVAMRCLAVMLRDFIKARQNIGISLDNQSTPDLPNLIPPYSYYVGWLLEATNLPHQFQKSRVAAYKLLCLVSIRRHDIELPQLYYAAFYEALHRGLTSSDTQIHASIIKNSAQILSMELPGCTFLVHDLLERSTQLLPTSQDLTLQLRAAEILGSILSLNHHIERLDQITSKEVDGIFETMLACSTNSLICALYAISVQVYQDLCDQSHSPYAGKLLDALMKNVQNSNDKDFFRTSCDLLRLFADHSQILSQSNPELVSTLIQTICQLVQRSSSTEDGKEATYCLLICLEDWCLALDKNYLMKPLSTEATSEDGSDVLTNCQDSLLTIVLRSLGKEEQQLACRASYNKLLTYIGHFPFKQVGPETMSCLISESDFFSGQKELTESNTAGMCLFVVNDSTIISFLKSTSKQAETARLIIRNISGKYSWEANHVDQASNPHDLGSMKIDPELFLNDLPERSSMKNNFDNDEENSSLESCHSRDYMSDLLNQLSSTLTNSSADSSSQKMNKRRNSAHSVSNPRLKIAQSEEIMIALLTNQRFQELNFYDGYENSGSVINLSGSNKSSHVSKQSGDEYDESDEQKILFEPCRQLIKQLNYLSWEKRCKIDSLAKDARLFRELKNLDSQPSRETHKIAVIYIANGQEDKNSILSNSNGSIEFNDFVSGLGWDVDLASHSGFKGGLQTNKSTGETSTYYCNCTTEIMYHISTKIPADPLDDESLNKKLRHIGNDEIHIVWSEHSRDYRRGIIPTEFGDVIITIYPMLTFYDHYRIQILTKPDVPPFGPLFDNCIVHRTSLAPLVRATAINASRARRFKLPHYQSHWEQRHKLISDIVQNHKEKLSFEDFATQLYQVQSYK